MNTTKKYQNNLIQIKPTFAENLQNYLSKIGSIFINMLPTKKKKMFRQIGNIKEYYDLMPIGKIKKNQKFKLKIKSNEIYNIIQYNKITKKYLIKRIFPSFPKETTIIEISNQIDIITNIRL